MREEDFQSKAHVTRHLTLNRFGRQEEATRINSWEENDYLNWKLFKAATLTPDNVSPSALKTIAEAAVKYRRAYRSYRYGLPIKIKGGAWFILPVLAVVGVFVALYFMGVFGGH